MKYIVLCVVALLMAGCETAGKIELEYNPATNVIKYTSTKDVSVSAAKGADGTMRIDIKTDATGVAEARSKELTGILNAVSNAVPRDR